jgi:hypothetical protein
LARNWNLNVQTYSWSSLVMCKSFVNFKYPISPEPLRNGPKFIWQFWLGMALGISSWNNDTDIKSWNTQYLNLDMSLHILASIGKGL